MKKASNSICMFYMLSYEWLPRVNWKPFQEGFMFRCLDSSCINNFSRRCHHSCTCQTGAIRTISIWSVTPFLRTTGIRLKGGNAYPSNPCQFTLRASVLHASGSGLTDVLFLLTRQSGCKLVCPALRQKRLNHLMV